MKRKYFSTLFIISSFFQIAVFRLITKIIVPESVDIGSSYNVTCENSRNLMYFYKNNNSAVMTKPLYKKGPCELSLNTTPYSCEFNEVNVSHKIHTLIVSTENDIPGIVSWQCTFNDSGEPSNIVNVTILPEKIPNDTEMKIETNIVLIESVVGVSFVALFMLTPIVVFCCNKRKQRYISTNSESPAMRIDRNSLYQSQSDEQINRVAPDSSIRESPVMIIDRNSLYQSVSDEHLNRVALDSAAQPNKENSELKSFRKANDSVSDPDKLYSEVHKER